MKMDAGPRTREPEHELSSCRSPSPTKFTVKSLDMPQVHGFPPLQSVAMPVDPNPMQNPMKSNTLSRMARLAITAATLVCARADADDILYVKNQWHHPLHIWVNGAYQGTAPPGWLSFIPQNGFCTENSGFQADGTLKIEHAYGGWQAAKEFRIRAACAPVDYKGEKVSFFSEGTISYGGQTEKIWTFGEGDLKLPTALEIEMEAVKLEQGGEPDGINTLIEAGTAEFTSDKSDTVTALMGMAGKQGQAASFKMMVAGSKKKGGAGQTFENSIGLKMIYLPDKKAYLAQTETTQSQFFSLMDLGPKFENWYRANQKMGINMAKNGNRPAVGLTYYACLQFCDFLTAKDREEGRLPAGYQYAIPSKELWLFACLTGESGVNEANLGTFAWYWENSKTGEWDRETRDVGTKKSNGLGFYDMRGNALERLETPDDSGEAIFYERPNLIGGSYEDMAGSCLMNSPGYELGYHRQGFYLHTGVPKPYGLRVALVLKK